MIPVIICGGFGTKMWPISRERRAKHFLPLINGKSLFQLNYEALATKFKPEEIYISTNNGQIATAQKQVPQIPFENFIIEPEAKNTGPAIGFIAASLYKKGFQDEPFFLVQVDDLREPIDKFIRMIEVTSEMAKSRTEYITGGMRPKSAVMGVDYLIKGEKVNSDDVGIYKVKEFVWRKPELETAQMIKDENVLIHTNHTCMTPKNYLEMYKKYRLDWYEPLMNIVNGADPILEFAKMTKGPQEEVTELVHRAGESLIVELPFTWNDFGTFKSLEDYLKAHDLYHPSDNVVDLDGKNNFVWLDDPNKPIVLIGVDNLVVVDTGDAVLICDKNSTGEVGVALKEVKERKLSLV